MGQAEAESWQMELEEQADNVMEHAASASDVAVGVFWSTDTSGDRIKRGLNCITIGVTYPQDYTIPLTKAWEISGPAAFMHKSWDLRDQ
jgi:hypothetical protein